MHPKTSRKRHPLTRLLCVAAAFSALAVSTACAADEEPLNVILIMADDLGWSDTTLYGTTSLYKTPNIERLADRGMVFTNAYAASPLCSPTRASILTGQTPARHGITAPGAHVREENPSFQASVRESAPPGSKALGIKSVGPLDNRLPTLGKMIRTAGLATGHFGKWHLGHPPFSPLEHGFDIDLPHHAGPGPGGSFIAPWSYAHYDNGTPGEHIEDRMAAEASKWVREQSQRGRSFYLQYWQFSVHAPFDAKPELKAKYAHHVDPDDAIDAGQDSPTYAAMVETLDDAVGTLLDTLDATGEADNTLIIFFSDNGGNEYNIILERDARGNPFLARPTDNAPLRGGKATIFEGGIRVPTVVVWPGVVEPHSRSDARIQSTDLYPTILHALGIEPPADHPIDGIDIRPALEGRELERPGGMMTYFPHDPGVPEWLPPNVAVHDGDWKLIRIFHEGENGAHRYLLYNLNEDIGETNNLAATHPDVVARLDALITAHLEDADAVVPLPNPRFNPAAYRPEATGVQRQEIPKLASFTMTPTDQKDADRLLADAFDLPAAKSKAAGGWRTPRPVDMQIDAEGLQLASMGDDPWITTQFDPVPTKGLKLRFEIRSESTGLVQVFQGEGPEQLFKPGRGHQWKVPVAKQWFAGEVALRDADEPLGALRIDPPGEKGLSTFRNIQLLDAQGRMIRSWIQIK